MTLRYAKVKPEKIHAEYTQALKNMSSQQIPYLLTIKKNSSSELFKELSRIIQKKSDQSSPSELSSKKLNQLQARLSKFKMEFNNNFQSEEAQK